MTRLKPYDGKGHGKPPHKRTKRFAVENPPTMTALEYFIYVCTSLFVMVFAIMQGVFLYKLHSYEATFDHPQSDKAAEVRILTQEDAQANGIANVPSTVVMSNRQRIEAVANATRREFSKWPPLDALVDEKDGKVIGNPQFLLDFGIVGFEKAGTKTLKLILHGHKEVSMWLDENTNLYVNKPGAFVSSQYDLKPNQDYLRGYICVNDIFQPSSLNIISEHFPETKLIIAIRHPVRFFESMYNARIQNLPDPKQPIVPPQERIGVCNSKHNGCCTDHAHLALWLYKLGKTLNMPQDSEIEQTIKNTHAFESEHSTLPTKNKIFIVEASQLTDQDWFRQEELLDDLQTFLGLKTPFQNGIPPAKPSPRSDTQDERDKRKIDICQDQFKNLREELMIGARETSQWLRERFLKSEDVFYSSPDYLEQSLLSWMEDPCSKKVVKYGKAFDTKNIEGEIPFKASSEPLLPVTPGELKRFDINKDGWPALEEIVDSDNRLIGDPQFLLDFAIIGLEKCGTSTLMQWFGSHPEVFCFQQEDPSLFMNQPGVLAKRLYKQFPGEEYKRGYKYPIDIFQPCSLRNFQEYFPETKLFIAVRHPVRYFESLYNFRIQNLPDPNEPFTPILERIGICNEHSQGVCTDHAHFAIWLWRLGKTLEMPMNDLQKSIKQVHPWEANHYTYPSTNKVFLVEMSQLADKNEDRRLALKRDLAKFLGLSHTFDDDVPHYVPGMKWSEESQAIRNSRKIDICEEKYRPLREELMKGAKESSLWIRSFFLASKDVYISSPEFFDEAMRAWMNDPCEDEAQADPRSLSKWPPLSSLVNDEGKIIADVQWLLDFAILGVEKCGTSTLMAWLGSHDEIQIPQVENYSLMNLVPGDLVRDMYAMAPYEEYKRAYKNPLDIFYPGTSLAYIDKYFPKTKLLITLRHPVFYFESLYNFRIQNHNEGSWKRSHILTPMERVGPCKGEAFDGCTEHAHFGLWLYWLGKTLSMPETEMNKKFSEAKPDGTKNLQPKAMQNEVFLFEMTQFADTDPDRAQQLKDDLRHFLGVTKDFTGTAPHKKPGKKWSPEIQAVRDSFKIKICEDKHKELRDILVQGARETSIWIRESFIKSPDVHISSPEFFEQAMLKWMDDPCENQNGD